MSPFNQGFENYGTESLLKSEGMHQTQRKKEDLFAPKFSFFLSCPACCCCPPSKKFQVHGQQRFSPCGWSGFECLMDPEERKKERRSQADFTTDAHGRNCGWATTARKRNEWLDFEKEKEEGGKFIQLLCLRKENASGKRTRRFVSVFELVKNGKWPSLLLLFLLWTRKKKTLFCFFLFHVLSLLSSGEERGKKEKLDLVTRHSFFRAIFASINV